MIPKDVQLALMLGYQCGLGERPEFQFPTVDKAFNEYWPQIKDEARNRGWVLGSKDDLERHFRRGFGKAINEKAAQRQ